ncbi:single-stranded-DNA-specific exonuclease RecJ [Candidatus Marinamargulisbacteria bacterium SCGC AG-343-D04]|nr:single-stranded-DNA-specific exonuclease RecJ [Candidatus Marinamargulisbacteria bacterium SCGC AG-343-D04]
MIEVSRWKLYPQHKDIALQLSETLDISPISSQLLLNRSIESLVEVKKYLGITQEFVQFDSSLLDSILVLIKKAINQKKPIFLYGDYDVDGMTSVSMMVKALTAIGATVRYKLPHRFLDGYGLNDSIVKLLQDESCGLLMTLDCGITNVNEITAIKKETDVDVVIVDHHQIPELSPPADLILNPKSEGTPSSLESLCTAGIVYKFIQFLSSHYDCIDCEDYIALAALGTVADVVPLQQENRVIVSRGLKVLSQRRNKGIKQLLECARVDKQNLSVDDIGFVIAPRLNAAGRLSTAHKGVELLLSQTDSQAKNIALQLEKLNQERRQLDTDVVAECLAMIEESDHYQKQPVLVIGQKNWHAGVIGIAASKLVSRFSRPVVIVGMEEEVGRGSARSFGQVNIYSLIKECQNHLTTFGGHKQAAGFSLKTEQFGHFKQALENVCAVKVNKEMLHEVVFADMALSGQDITDQLLRDIDVLSPFGHGNQAPLFYSDSFAISDSRLVGNGKHLKVTLQCKKSRKKFDGIGFNLGEKLPKVYNKEQHFLFSVERNIWNGRESIQLNIKDIK